MTGRPNRQPAHMQNDQNLPAGNSPAGDDDALWNELEAAERGTPSEQPPIEGRAEPDDPAFEPETEGQPEAALTEGQSQEPAPEAGNSAQPSDVWASAPPELKAAYEEERRARNNLEHRIRSDDGRVAAMQRRIAELESKLPKPRENAPPGETPQDRAERLKQLREDYPEVAQPILQEMDEMRQTVETLRSLEEQRMQQGFAYQESVLAENHADWRQVLGSNGATFQAWLEDQPKAVRESAMLNANQIVDANAAADVVGRFKQFLGMTPTQPAQATSQAPLNDRRQRQLAASAAPRGNAGRPVASGIPENGDEAAIWAAFEAQEAQEARLRR